MRNLRHARARPLSSSIFLFALQLLTAPSMFIQSLPSIQHRGDVSIFLVILGSSHQAGYIFPPNYPKLVFQHHGDFVDPCGSWMPVGPLLGDVLWPVHWTRHGTSATQMNISWSISDRGYHGQKIMETMAELAHPLSTPRWLRSQSPKRRRLKYWWLINVKLT